MLQNGGGSATAFENPSLVGTSNTRFLTAMHMLQHPSAMLPSRLHASAGNLVVAMRKLNLLAKQRELVREKLIALKEKRAVLFIQKQKFPRFIIQLGMTITIKVLVLMMSNCF